MAPVDAGGKGRMNRPLRIAVFGPESTGKTTLAGKLAAHFSAPLVAEYAREFWDAHGVITLEDIPTIAREQWRREDEACVRRNRADDLGGTRPPDGLEKCAREKTRSEAGFHLPAPKLIICDTEALTTMLWSDLLYGTCPDDIRRGVEARAKNYGLYLLLDIDVPWTPDPQRCFPDEEDRKKCWKIWRGALERRHLPFSIIRGDWAQREQAAIAAVEAMLP